MSIIYCEKHDRRWDSDYLEMCPLCECEPEENDMNTPNQTKEWLKFRKSQFADTSHIQTCRAAWLNHFKSCALCYDVYDALAYAMGKDEMTPKCEQGIVLYDEYAASITANPNCEVLEGKEPT